MLEQLATDNTDIEGVTVDEAGATTDISTFLPNFHKISFFPDYFQNFIAIISGKCAWNSSHRQPYILLQRRIEDFPGRIQSKGGANLLFGQISSRKVNKNGENWTERGQGASPKFYYVDPPLHSVQISLFLT